MNMYAMHDSFDERFRSPLGARRLNDEVSLSIFLTVNASVKLKFWINGRENETQMLSSSYHYGKRAGYIYSCRITMPDTPCLVFYSFFISVCGKTYYYCGKHGEGFLTEEISSSYQITVYEPYSLPDWYKNCVMYQIFPDRFARSSESGGLSRVGTHVNAGKRVYLHTDWNEEVNYAPLPHESYYTPCDFFCGDLLGIEENLPYLKSLSVGCLYLNPVFEAESNHRYDTGDYMHIDGILGGDEAFFSLKNACQAENIRIMLDGVFSHTGADSVYFNKYGRYHTLGAYQSKNSEYFSWYDFIEYPQRYKSWWGFEDLPEVCEDDPSYRAFIEQVADKWKTSWRLDVADELTDDFIKFLRKRVKAANSEAVVIGEVWEDASDKHSKGIRRGYTNGDELDGVMNYPLRQNIVDFLMYKISAENFVYNMKAQQENYPEEFIKGSMNILGSHDTVRILTVLCNAPERDALPKEEQSKVIFSGNELTNGKKKVILAMIIQFATMGVPCIYYGDEIGMQGMADPFCRRTFDMKRTENNEILEAYRQIAGKRTSHAAFSGGQRLIAISDDVLAVERYACDKRAFCVVNRSGEERRVKIDKAGDGTVYTDALSSRVYSAYRNTLEFTLEAYGGAFLCSL